MKQIVIHVVNVARKQHNGCFDAYNGIKDAWNCVSDHIVFLCSRAYWPASLHITFKLLFKRSVHPNFEKLTKNISLSDMFP